MDRKGPAGQKPRQIAADSRWRESAAGIPAHNLIMALPWLRIIDAALGVTDLMRGRRGRGFAADEESQQLAPGAAIGGLETRLAGVVVAALKEALIAIRADCSSSANSSRRSGGGPNARCSSNCCARLAIASLDGFVCLPAQRSRAGSGRCSLRRASLAAP